MKSLMCMLFVALGLVPFFGFADVVTERQQSSSEVVFVEADGWKLTSSIVSNTVMIRARMYELAKKPIPKDNFEYWANRFGMGSAAGLLQSHLLEQELQKRGVKRTAESDSVVLASYNRFMRTKYADESEMARQFGPLEEQFRLQFERKSLFESFLSSSPKCQVSDAEIAARYHQLSNRLERSVQVNSNAYVKANAALCRLRAGEDWFVVASNVTEDALIEETYADNWEDWGLFKLKDVEPEDLVKALVTMNVGDYSQPIETDEGLIIVKVLSKDDDCYSLARILFRMGVKVEFPEHNQMVAELVVEKRDALQQVLLPELRSRANISYPMGTNFVYKIWTESPKSTSRRGARLGGKLLR